MIKRILDKLITLTKRFVSLRFFSRNETLQNAWQVIGWWESRRLIYNIIVGITGIGTCAIMLGAALFAESYLGEPIGMPDPPIFAIFVMILYGIMANICFTGGWLAEIVANKIWGEKSEFFGVISFTFGVIFSVLLTLFPAVFTVLFIMIQVGFRLIYGR